MMKAKLSRIGILTSGGDAPGMNAAIRAAARTCVLHGIAPIGIHRGYNGLIHSDVVELDARAVNGITSHGGTILYTARCEEFKTEEGLQKAVSACRYLGLDGIVAIGGDGTFRGAGKTFGCRRQHHWHPRHDRQRHRLHALFHRVRHRSQHRH